MSTRPLPEDRKFLEGQSVRITGTIKDPTGAALGASALATLTATVYDARTKALIGSWNARDILNANGGSVSSVGAFALVIPAADNARVDARNTEEYELHVVRLQYTWLGLNSVTETTRQEELFGLRRAGR